MDNTHVVATSDGIGISARHHVRWIDALNMRLDYALGAVADGDTDTAAACLEALIRENTELSRALAAIVADFDSN